MLKFLSNNSINFNDYLKAEKLCSLELSNAENKPDAENFIL